MNENDIITDGNAQFKVCKVTNNKSVSNLSNEVNSLKDKANARYGFIKLPVININSSNTQYDCSVTITTKGNPVYLHVSGDNNPSTSSCWFNIYLYRNDVALTHQIDESHGSSWNIPFSLCYLDVVPAGTYTYKCSFTYGSGDTVLGEDGSIQSPQFIVFEI